MYLGCQVLVYSHTLLLNAVCLLPVLFILSLDHWSNIIPCEVAQKYEYTRAKAVTSQKKFKPSGINWKWMLFIIAVRGCN
jgi:hypothetical protein